MLFTVWTRIKGGATTLYMSPEAFSEFFNVTVDEATNSLGPNGYQEIRSPEEARALGESLDALMALAQQRDAAGAV